MEAADGVETKVCGSDLHKGRWKRAGGVSVL